MKITKEKLKELIKEVIKEQQEVDLSNHPNRSVASYFKVMLRQPPSRHWDLANLWDDMISTDPNVNALATAATLGFTSGLVKFHQRGLKDVTGLPTGEDLFTAAQAAAQVRRDAEEKARAEREANPPPPRDMADIVYPRDSRGKIIGRAD
jgi:hypothetical protein